MNISAFFPRVISIGPEPDYKTFRAQGLNPDPKQVPNPTGLLMPHGAPFTQDDLARLLIFQQIILQAHSDGIERVLILDSKVSFTRGFKGRIEGIVDNLPREWDLLYLGWKDASFRDKPTPKQRLYQVNYATGTYALGINNRFYHLFLEDTRVPLYPLDEHLKSVSLASNVFVINPPEIISS
jgi:hypothetical protein